MAVSLVLQVLTDKVINEPQSSWKVRTSSFSQNFLRHSRRQKSSILILLSFGKKAVLVDVHSCVFPARDSLCDRCLQAISRLCSASDAPSSAKPKICGQFASIRNRESETLAPALFSTDRHNKLLLLGLRSILFATPACLRSPATCGSPCLTIPI